MDSIDVLYKIVKPIATTIPVYKELMTEDADSIPDSYILLRSDITNSGRIYGDGSPIIRTSDCDILLVTKGTAKNSKDLHNVNRRIVEATINKAGYDFIGVNLGYDEANNRTEYDWSIEVLHG